ncbi:hypothetical protein [Amedibacillus dolichus]|uniref:hypothetical protein n=1 Tax=Amedibacillus dolichus TaxID=31971 RepID=UPI0021755F89|nr:hypothetical protein [Amedibacillus dolichus]
MTKEHVLAKQLLNAVWNEDVELAGIVLDAGADANWYLMDIQSYYMQYLHAMRKWLCYYWSMGHSRHRKPWDLHWIAVSEKWFVHWLSWE